MILMIDNYDSFTYNLVQVLAGAGAEVQVVRNDAESVKSLLARGPEGIVLSPGPGRPEDAGVCLELLRTRACIPLLGVCLGHQSLGMAFGATVDRAPKLMHGKTSAIRHDGRTLFESLPDPFTATRYHSLIVARASVPECLEVSAWTEDGIVMGLRHREWPVHGVQFHPESVLTPVGRELAQNFLERSA